MFILLMKFQIRQDSWLLLIFKQPRSKNTVLSLRMFTRRICHIVIVLLLLLVGVRGGRGGYRGGGYRGGGYRGGGTYYYAHRKNGRIHYAGATNNFERRHKEHRKAHHYYADTRYYKRVTQPMPHSSPQQRFNKEKILIRQMKPVANKHPGGNGKRAP